MSVELETAGVGALPGLLRGKRRHAPPPGTPCANCGTPLEGAYCHACGQDSDTHKRSIRHLAFEAVEGLFELDGRLWRTLPALFFRPGGLARDYIEGRIVRHVPPFRTFLVALLLFIFAAEHAAHQQTLAQADEKRVEAAKLATPQGRAEKVRTMRAEAGKDLKESLDEDARDRAGDLKDPDAHPDKVEAAYARRVARAQARYQAALSRADRVAQGLPAVDPPGVATDQPFSAKRTQRETWWKAAVKKAVANPEYYWSVVFEWGHRLAVVLLPIVGLNLAMVYAQRKDVFLYDHLLVAMNVLSFNFLLSAAGLMLPLSWMEWWFLGASLWSLANLFQTLRGAYRSSVLGAALKTAVVWSVAFFAFVFLLVGVFMLALAQL
ncbi:MAG TPA: DUF3667 domain-containing protein [Phenylobacterium sp.]|uniref:DUF3667 domain-containing protein n=1 Tax=Phenylobacterium sp. TaxID=1871053 RepID=UPI002C05270A|nr:DUF3667 domain-containing protein [Phenylobacterium sp.]HXA38929.1 DUF3667 domain-containing protein [Phenylobacterium sp.]